MLARMLRITIAMQMAFGAALGYWLSAGSAGLATTLSSMLVVAMAAPFVGNSITVTLTFFKSRAAEPTAQWVRALRGELLASAHFFLLRQPWSFAKPTLQPATGAQASVPVLLVHGFVSNHRAWDSLVTALQAQGHCVMAIDLEPLFCSIDDYAAQLEQAVQTLRQHSGQGQVALVGHSMGGLAIRAWMRRFGTAHVARAITLGAPHAGTQAKAMASTVNSVQAGWHSDWLQELAASETDTTRSLFRLALSPQDNIVFPQRAQTLPGVAPMVFEGRGHLQLLTDPQVQQWLLQELALG
jgi:pimeloyl-ACP methyl ester carboxylesterase